MKCPNCQAELKEQDLVSKSTHPSASWFEFNTFELYCPECNTKLTYSKLPQIVGGLGFAVYVCMFIFNLISPNNAFRLHISLLSLGIFIFCLIYWHRNKKLISVE